MTETAIEFKKVAKKYFKGGKYQPNFREWLGTITTGKGFQRLQFKALDEVSFTIKKGRAIGIIGSNGAGKTTILRLIARITYPNSGEILVNGKIAGLLELGAGFHGELTGEENVYLYGSILGLSKSRIKEVYPEIVRFSELKDFMDHPIKHYSSGMVARLAFSVSIFVEPDILLIDEILAVGDISFRKKCLKFMKNYIKNPKNTVILVSHSAEQVREVCDEVIWIEEGKIKMRGLTKKVLAKYIAFQENK
jgi:ABC-type polysaccharide/polyol phosphate transport system ATPase subunit